jgi:hypothetical protein
VDALAAFRQVWFADFEFTASAGERPVPLCVVARELRTGRLVRTWLADGAPIAPPYPTGPDVLFVAYYASAEVQRATLQKGNDMSDTNTNDEDQANGEAMVAKLYATKEEALAAKPAGAAKSLKPFEVRHSGTSKVKSSVSWNGRVPSGIPLGVLDVRQGLDAGGPR